MDIDWMTADELMDANARCRQYAGKALEDCTRDDIVRVRAGLAIELKFLKIMRDQELHEIRQIIDNARRRGEGRRRHGER